MTLREARGCLRSHRKAGRSTPKSRPRHQSGPREKCWSTLGLSGEKEEGQRRGREERGQATVGQGPRESGALRAGGAPPSRVGSLVPKFQGADWQGGHPSSGAPGLGGQGWRRTRREPGGFLQGPPKRRSRQTPQAQSQVPGGRGLAAQEPGGARAWGRGAHRLPSQERRTLVSPRGLSVPGLPHTTRHHPSPADSYFPIRRWVHRGRQGHDQLQVCGDLRVLLRGAAPHLPASQAMWSVSWAGGPGQTRVRREGPGRLGKPATRRDVPRPGSCGPL